jgi:membrane protein YdbS with pleckstrin-like domain
MKCGQCGGEAPADSAFCPHCGAQLSDAEPATAAPAPTGAARLQPAASTAGGPAAEQSHWSGSYSPKAMIGWIVGAALLSILVIVAISMAGGDRSVWMWAFLGIVVLWCAVGLVAWYQKVSVRYELTTHRLFHERGFLSRTRDRIEVIDIDDVTLTQGPIERMLNVGTILVRSSDTTTPMLRMAGIDDARRVTDMIDNTRRAERQRRGIFMENL